MFARKRKRAKPDRKTLVSLVTGEPVQTTTSSAINPAASSTSTTTTANGDAGAGVGFTYATTSINPDPDRPVLTIMLKEKAMGPSVVLSTRNFVFRFPMVVAGAHFSVDLRDINIPESTFRFLSRCHRHKPNPLANVNGAFVLFYAIPKNVYSEHGVKFYVEDNKGVLDVKFRLRYVDIDGEINQQRGVPDINLSDLALRGVISELKSKIRYDDEEWS